MRGPGVAVRDVPPDRLADGSALLGGLGWVGVAPFVDHAIRLFLLAPLVLVPLGLSVVATPTRTGDHALAYRLAVVLQPPAALLVVPAMWLPTGLLAGALVVPWLCTTLVVAGFGLWRLAGRGWRPLPESVVDAGLLYLPVGGAWLVAHRLDLAVGSFSGPIVLFTAVHFHYAGFVVPVVAGVGGRLLAGRRRHLYRGLAPGAMVGPGLVAVGIAAAPTLEVVAVVGYTVAVVGLVAAIASGVRSSDTEPAASEPTAALAVGGLAVASVAVAGSMAFAFAYGVATFGDVAVGLTNALMVALHGSLNAVFAVSALVSLRWIDPPIDDAAPTPGIPYSRLRSRGRVGRDYFERRGLVDGRRSATGMVPDFAAFERPEFDPAAVAPPVRAVYERSAATDLRISADWRPGLRLVGRFVGRITGRLEQLHLPPHGTRIDALDSAVSPVDEPGEARPDARAWTRWYVESGRAMYVASYETHVHDGIRYLNVAFPLPGCTLVGVLRPENDGDGLVLSSHRDGGDDAGLYLGTPLGLVRLPLAERLRLHPADDDSTAGDVVAVHDVTLLGWRVVRLTYDIDIIEAPEPEPSPEADADPA